MKRQNNASFLPIQMQNLHLALAECNPSKSLKNLPTEIMRHKGAIFASIITIFLYAMLTFVAFPHLLSGFSTTIAGEFDAYWFLWYISHFYHAVDSGSSPFLAPEIFAPYGTNLYVTTTLPLIMALGYVPYKIFGLIGAYNFLFLISFVLSGFTMFLLARHFAGDSYAAFAAGIIFAFSTNHIAYSLRYINLMSIQWLPLLFLAYFKFRESPTTKNTFFIFSMFVVTGYSELMFLGMFGFYVLYDVLSVFFSEKRTSLQFFIPKMALVLGVSFIFLMPLLIPMSIELMNNEYEGDSPLELVGTSAFYSASVLDYFFPPYSSILYSGLFGNFIGVSENFHLLFLGYFQLSVLAISIFIFQPILRKWQDISALFFILSLGPFITLFGYLIPFVNPFIIFSIMPIGSFLMRVPARFSVFLTLSLAVVFALVFRHFMEKFKITGIKKLVILSVCVAVLFSENLFVPPYLDLSSNSFYDSVSKDSGKYIILDIPYKPEYFSPPAVKYIYLQTIHGKDISAGAVSRMPFSLVRQINSTGCVRSLMDIDMRACNGTSELKALDIRYVIYHKNEPEFNIPNVKTDTSSALSVLSGIFGPSVYSDAEIAVFEVR